MGIATNRQNKATQGKAAQKVPQSQGNRDRWQYQPGQRAQKSVIAKRFDNFGNFIKRLSLCDTQIDAFENRQAGKRDYKCRYARPGDRRAS